MIRLIQLSDCIKHIPLVDWQNMNHLPSSHLAPHIHLLNDNVTDNGDIIMNELLINIFEEIREKVGKPIKINSGYRSEKKQAELIKQGYKAAEVSPHCQGWALDLDYGDTLDGRMLLACARNIRSVHNGYIRIGYKQYLDAGQSFIHIDIAPYCYEKLKGKFNGKELPSHWKELYAEW